MGWIVHAFGWEHVFVVMGAAGIVFSAVWLKYIHNPKDHPMISTQELDHIVQGGAVVDMDVQKGNLGRSGATSSSCSRAA